MQMSKFQKTILTFIATTITPEEDISHIKGLFLQNDQNGSGKINIDELKMLYEKYSMSATMGELEDLIKVIDQD
jgi:Ca2+-binding EF-hand superfamily protein